MITCWSVEINTFLNKLDYISTLYFALISLMPFQLVFREIFVESLQCLLHLLSLFLNASRFYRKTFLVFKIKKRQLA